MKKLRTIGINTIGDAAHADPDILRSILGEKAGDYICRSANGISNSPVEAEVEDAKGYSNEVTTVIDISEDNYRREMPPLIRELSESVSRRLQRDHVRAFTVGVMVKTDSFKRHSRQTKLADSSNEETVIERTAMQLMDSLLLGEGGLFRAGNSIRLVGVFASSLDRGNYRQINLMEALENMKQAEKEREEKKAEEAKRTAGERKAEEEEKQRKIREASGKRALEEMMEKIRSRYGRDAVRKGTEK